MRVKEENNLTKREPEEIEDEERHLDEAEHRKKNTKQENEEKEKKANNETDVPLFPAAPLTSPISVGHRRQSGRTDERNDELGREEQQKVLVSRCTRHRLETEVMIRTTRKGFLRRSTKLHFPLRKGFTYN